MLLQTEFRQHQALKRQEELIAEEEEAGRLEDERQAAKQQVCWSTAGAWLLLGLSGLRLGAAGKLAQTACKQHGTPCELPNH
jgi:hypothetical protein